MAIYCILVKRIPWIQSHVPIKAIAGQTDLSALISKHFAAMCGQDFEMKPL